MMNSFPRRSTEDRIKARLEHICGEAKQGIFALTHGDEESLALALDSIQRVSREALRQLREIERYE